MEFVQAVGETLRAASAHTLAWRLIFGAWKRGAAVHLGLPASVPAVEIGRRLAVQTGKPFESYASRLAEYDRAAAEPRLSSRRFTTLVDDLAKMEMEERNGRPKRK
jgi:hypothetical protein